ncbi:hypothetical protein D3C76_1514400 [compost metagenome]
MVAQHDRRDQQHTPCIGRFDTDQVHRLRHRHAPVPVGPFEGGAPHRLRQQIVAERRAEFALRLAVHHHHILIPLGSQLQLAVGIEFAQGKTAQALIPHAALERRPLIATDPFGE